MPSRRFPNDLTDAQWTTLEPLIPPVKPGGSPWRVTMRPVLDGIFNLPREGCSWRALPHDFPHPRVGFGYLRRFQADGT